MSKVQLTEEEKGRLIEAINNGVEPDPDLLPKIFPGTSEKYDIHSLDRAKIPTLEYAGKRSKAAILAEGGAGIGAAPLQVVRSFGESPDGEWKNLIVQGDNLQFLKTCYRNVDPLIKDKFKGKVKLIYIDPPFATKSDFGGNNGERSYVDKVATSEFIEGLRERMIYLRELLTDDGVILTHIDYRKGHYLKVALDEVFGESNYRNEIVVKRGTKNVQNQFKTISSLASGHDMLYFYSKSAECRFEKLTSNLSEMQSGSWNNHWRGTDRPTMRYELFGVTPSRGQWRWSKDRTMLAVKNYNEFIENKNEHNLNIDEYFLEKLSTTGERIDFVRQNDRGTIEHYVPPVDYKILSDTWLDIPAYERNGYPTQKSEFLLTRIIEGLSQRNDLVLDCFAGSGTTAAVAEKLGRRWVMCDFGKHAIYTMQKRMLRIGESKALQEERDRTGEVIVKQGAPYEKSPKPFSVVSTGAYDFSHIMDLRKHREAYIDFVLGLFQLARDDEKAQRFRISNIYATKDGDPVEIYPVWEDEYLKHVRINEEYLQEIIKHSGNLRGTYYIIAPESCTNVDDTVLQNSAGKDVEFKFLTFPYKVLEDVSRSLELQEQPSSQENVNNLITSTAFYFNEDVEIEIERAGSKGLKITHFRTRILDTQGNRFEGISGLAMLLIDLDYEPDKPFDMDKTVFVKEISDDWAFKVDGLTKSIGIIAIDKHGNESKPYKER